MAADLVFLDIECMGLDQFAPVWEFAAVRRYADGTQQEYHCFIDHDPVLWLSDLPDAFRKDYQNRYRPADALTTSKAADLIWNATVDAHVVGAVPSFDTERLMYILLRAGCTKAPWHYHLIDVENLAVGYLAAKGVLPPMPWKSDQLSAAIDVDPGLFKRHTALGDVLWCMAQYDAVMGHD